MNGCIRRGVLAGVLLVALASCGRANPPPPGWPLEPGPRPTPSNPASPSTSGGGLIDLPIAMDTRERITRSAEDVAVCRATLQASRVEMTPIPDRDAGTGCTLFGGGTLDVDWGTVARLSPGKPEMTCETALAFSIWRRQSVEPAAREILGSEVVQIDLMGAYSCRNVNGAATGRRSAHARGNAIDVGGVRLRDGRRVTVLDHWPEGSDEARFLRRIRDDACRLFGTVLSPDYNAAHHNHLHLEVQEADWTMCR